MLDKIYVIICKEIEYFEEKSWLYFLKFNLVGNILKLLGMINILLWNFK